MNANKTERIKIENVERKKGKGWCLDKEKGRTAARVLETAVTSDGRFQPGGGWTDLYIFPPYRMLGVDGLLTNFHLPRSSLLMLVSAFAGREFVLEAYRHAVREEYRFYSYGDAMLIL